MARERREGGASGQLELFLDPRSDEAGRLPVTPTSYRGQLSRIVRQSSFRKADNHTEGLITIEGDRAVWLSLRT